MDRRTKKRIAGLKTKLDTLRRKLAGAKSQADDPGELSRVEAEIAKTNEALERLRAE